MDCLSSIVLGILFAFAFTLYPRLSYLWRNKFKKLPPGPTPLPIIGNLHLLCDQPHRSFESLSKKYGPVMSLKLGYTTTVVISSSGAAKEVLKNQDLAFSNRSVPDTMHAIDHSKFSVVWLPVASQWRKLRKTMNSCMLSGNRLDANQHLRRKKVQELIDYCQRHCETGEAVNVGRATFRTALNLLSNTIFSKDLADPYSDSAKEFKDVVSNILEEAGKFNLADCFPVLTKFDPQGTRRRMEDHFQKLWKILSGLVDERLEQRETRGRERGDRNIDVLDVLLTTNQETPDEGIDRNQIQHMFLDIFIAGTDTSSNTLEWAMAEMLRSPDIMKKTQAELAEIIGKGKVIEETDIARLPYLWCVVKETLRLHSPAPLLVARTVEQDVELWGYKVPKRSRVLVNAWAIGRDETVWKDPLAFKPERFLESELDVRGRDFELMPFGAGRRICPGLPLAIRMVPVMLGSLLNSFNWKLESGIAPKDLDMDEKFGITLQKTHPLHAVPCQL